MDNVISSDSETNQLEILEPQIFVVKDSASGIVIRADRVLDQSNSQNEKLENLFEQLTKSRSDASDLIETLKWEIEKVELLQQKFANTAPVENRERIIADAERYLTQIKENESE